VIDTQQVEAGLHAARAATGNAIQPVLDQLAGWGGRPPDTEDVRCTLFANPEPFCFAFRIDARDETGTLRFVTVGTLTLDRTVEPAEWRITTARWGP
jgi:hypothetical protein